MYYTILIDVDPGYFRAKRIQDVIEEYIGVHRVTQLGGIVYRGFVSDYALDELIGDLDAGKYYGRYGRYHGGCFGGYMLYVKEQIESGGLDSIEDWIDYNKVLKRRRWLGTRFETTLGPV